MKARDSTEKQAWNTALLKAMLQGFGKKLSDSDKTKVMQIEENAIKEKG